jgi:hypothetical protein
VGRKELEAVVEMNGGFLAMAKSVFFYGFN